MTIQEAFNLAVQKQRAGQRQEAESIYRQILQHDPRHADAAAALGALLHDTGRPEEAAAVYRHGLHASPTSAQLWCNLGNTLCDLDQPEAAIDACRQCIALDANNFGALNNLGNALRALGRLDESAAAYRRAIALRPDFPYAHNNLGNVLARQDDLQGAIACFRQAMKLLPNYAEAMSNLANALDTLGQYDAAIDLCRQSLVHRPDFALLHWNLALLLLRRGDFETGWREYEWRWQTRYLISSPLKHSKEGLWTGGDLTAKRILIHTEQGMGDAIQFARFLPRLTQLGAIVTLYTYADLVPLLATVDGVTQAVAWPNPIPDYDLQCPLLSLPGLFKTTVETIPATVPYVKVDPARAEKWREKLQGETRRKIGLAWAGKPKHHDDHHRSMSLQTLAPLREIPNARFISLQKGPAAQQIAQAPFELTDWSAELNDFADTAALIDQLDLVITVDTAVCHLAGALGKKVWTLLPFSADWRWMLMRNDSPWYPTMRLFRQPAVNDWQGVVNEMMQSEI